MLCKYFVFNFISFFIVYVKYICVIFCSDIGNDVVFVDVRKDIIY